MRNRTVYKQSPFLIVLIIGTIVTASFCQTDTMKIIKNEVKVTGGEVENIISGNENVTINYYSKSLDNNSVRPIFNKNIESLDILVLPFKNICSTNNSIGDIITLRINDFIELYGLKSSIKYLKLSDEEPYEKQVVSKILNFHNADLVVYGRFMDKECNNSVDDIVYLNYLTDDGWAHKKNDFSSAEQFEGTINSLKEIADGKMQGNIDFMTLFISGIIQYKKNNLKSSLNIFRTIHEEYDSTSSHTLYMLKEITLKQGAYFDSYKYLIELKNIPKNEQEWIYHNSFEHWKDLAKIKKGLGEY